MPKSKSDFSYWKYPWQPWLVLLVVVLQLLLLRSGIHDYRILAAAGVFSPEELRAYLLQQSFSCTLSGSLAFLFLGLFLIGTFARSRRAADLSGAVLFLLLFCGLAVCGLAFGFYKAPASISALWIVYLLLSLFGSLYDVYRGKKGQGDGR